MGNDPDSDAAEERQAEGDRFWILLDKGQLASQGDAVRRTLVIRDGGKILISIPVGRGSALAVPLRVDQLPCAGARLVVRLASETTPCPHCVDEHLTAACEHRGGLDAQGILAAIRAAIERCAALSQADPEHGAEPAPSSSTGGVGSSRLTPRSGVTLRLVPTNAPQVDAGGVLGDVDLLLIL